MIVKNGVDMKAKAPRFLVFIGTVILILVPTAFTAVGWQTIRLECVRHDSATAPSCEVQNGYLFGLFKTSPRRIENVSGVGMVPTASEILEIPAEQPYPLCFWMGNAAVSLSLKPPPMLMKNRKGMLLNN
jgi:hypothetical protein